MGPFDELNFVTFSKVSKFGNAKLCVLLLLIWSIFIQFLDDKNDLYGSDDASQHAMNEFRDDFLTKFETAISKQQPKMFAGYVWIYCFE